MLDADTIHAVILLLGLVVLFDMAVREGWSILGLMGVSLIWTLAYYGFVKLLPPELSGQ